MNITEILQRAVEFKTSDVHLVPGASLRAVLRQDPDVVLIGELRDLETIAAALTAATAKAQSSEGLAARGMSGA